MSTTDPGHTAGQQVYQPIAPDCVCGHAEVVHELGVYRGQPIRRKCHTGTKNGPCGCLAYVEKEGTDG